MRKLVLNKWFLLAALLILSLSAFSVVAYKQARRITTDDGESCRKPRPTVPEGDMLWDVLSRQFSSVSLPQ